MQLLSHPSLWGALLALGLVTVAPGHVVANADEAAAGCGQAKGIVSETLAGAEQADPNRVTREGVVIEFSNPAHTR